MNKLFVALTILSFLSCKSKTEKIKPTVNSISESIYASGTIKSLDQYQAFATVNGIIENIYVTERDTVKKGDPILSIANEAQRLSKENAELAAKFADFNSNQDKLNDAQAMIELAKNKMKNDSALYFRQKALWQQQVGSKVELESRELAYENSKTSYNSAQIKYDDLKRQLNFTSSQSKKNLMIAGKQESDFTLRSEIDGVVFDLLKEKGEIVGLQTPLAIIGNPKKYILEMQIDEYDIFKLKVGQPVIVSMDSYKGQVFEASVTKIYPIMNERSKTFLAEAEFINPPQSIFPNISFEANVVLQTKEKALLIPRNYVMNDSIVTKSNGDKVTIKTGLKDYEMIEVLSGISSDDELIKPVQ
jgi:multidrug efflux pump subunit AcrA (membrane-fusion protein)